MHSGDSASRHHGAKRAAWTVCEGVDLRGKAAAASTRARRTGSPLAPAGCEWPRTAVESILCCRSSVRPGSTKRRQQGFPDALFGPAPKAAVGRVPFVVAPVHVAPQAAGTLDERHPVEELPIVVRRTRLATSLAWQEARRSPTIPRPSGRLAPMPPPKGSLESDLSPSVSPLSQQDPDVQARKFVLERRRIRDAQVKK